MCPPDRCCCFPLHQGVKVVTYVFAVLQALGIITAIAAFSSFSQLACAPQNASVMSEACEDDGSGVSRMRPEVYNLAAGALAGSIIFGIIQLAASVYAIGGLNAFDARRIRRFYVFTAVVLGIQIILRLLDVGSPDATAVTNAWTGALLQALLGGWYVFALKTLSERIASGQITRDDPTGAGISQSGNVELGRPPHAQAAWAAQPPPPAYAAAASSHPVPQVAVGTPYKM
ncbi:hypothetical protein KFE25_006503 [Diacronema lutheri]|uniref:Uncharacterized protein n=1 Tax=Diacronema lutheri TaxID=2081491 RepID=A0A8J6CJK8_DIALT|nr:hypothetical protein KFE25_006503 [Diacronema lutheri]